MEIETIYDQVISKPAEEVLEHGISASWDVLMDKKPPKPVYSMAWAVYGLFSFDGPAHLGRAGAGILKAFLGGGTNHIFGYIAVNALPLELAEGFLYQSVLPEWKVSTATFPPGFSTMGSFSRKEYSISNSLFTSMRSA